VPVGLRKSNDTSESDNVSATPCWQKQQMGVANTEDKSNGHLAWPDSHRPRRLG